MPKPRLDFPDASAEHSIICEEATDVSLLAAGDPVFGDLVPDDYKAYVRFRICTAFPKIIGPELHGRYFGFHPQVLATSYKGLLHQQTNLGHTLKIYGGYRDRIMGGIVGVAVGNLQRRPLQQIADSVAAAQYLDCIGVIWKLAEGVRDLLGNHLSARQKSSVSIEVGSKVSDFFVVNPTDWSLHTLAAADEQWPGLLRMDKKNGLQIGQVDGVQFAFSVGGDSGVVPFRGVGHTPTPAETGTARIIDLRAQAGMEDSLMAAIAIPDWQAGQPVAWLPAIYGTDAGRGVVTEVILSGSHRRHGMTKSAAPADPLLDIKVHGKRLSVLRHASSVKKIREKGLTPG